MLDKKNTETEMQRTSNQQQNDTPQPQAGMMVSFLQQTVNSAAKKYGDLKNEIGIQFKIIVNTLQKPDSTSSTHSLYNIDATNSGLRIKRTSIHEDNIAQILSCFAQIGEIYSTSVHKIKSHPVKKMNERCLQKNLDLITEMVSVLNSVQRNFRESIGDLYRKPSYNEIDEVIYPQIFNSETYKNLLQLIRNNFETIIKSVVSADSFEKKFKGKIAEHSLDSFNAFINITHYLSREGAANAVRNMPSQNNSGIQQQAPINSTSNIFNNSTIGMTGADETETELTLNEVSKIFKQTPSTADLFKMWFLYTSTFLTKGHIDFTKIAIALTPKSNALGFKRNLVSILKKVKGFFIGLGYSLLSGLLIIMPVLLTAQYLIPVATSIFVALNFTKTAIQVINMAVLCAALISTYSITKKIAEYFNLDYQLSLPAGNGGSLMNPSESQINFTAPLNAIINGGVNALVDCVKLLLAVFRKNYNETVAPVGAEAREDCFRILEENFNPLEQYKSLVKEAIANIKRGEHELTPREGMGGIVQDLFFSSGNGESPDTHKETYERMHKRYNDGREVIQVIC